MEQTISTSTPILSHGDMAEESTDAIARDINQSSRMMMDGKLNEFFRVY